MERNLFGKLEGWKNKKKRKPLIIQGARQVGKTWIMKEFGKRYFKDTIYINFDNNEVMKNVFEIDFDISRIISAIKIEYGKNFEVANTLIIFDEIQEAPKALASLKYCSWVITWCCTSSRNIFSGRESGFYAFISVEFF